MPPRLLLSCFEVPGVGGSSTASFDLFARMRRDGHDVHYVNLIAEEPAYLSTTFGESLGNPSGLPGVHNFWLTDGEARPHSALSDLVETIGPDIVLGFGFPAALFFKRNLPHVRTVLMTGSCRQASAYVTSGRADDAVDLLRRLERSKVPPRALIHSERLAVEKCDLIVTHSELTLEFMTRFYPAALAKIYPRVVSYCEWIHEAASVWSDRAKPFDERDIDILFVANDWDRKEKNYPMVEAIAGLFRGRSVHVVGDAPRQAPGAVHHGFIANRADLFEIMGRTRCVVSPSLIDAAPGILFEGSALGCNLIASRNCGNVDVCNEALVVTEYDPAHFASVIEKAIVARFPDDVASCLASGSYEDLLGVMNAFANPFDSRDAA